MCQVQLNSENSKCLRNKLKNKTALLLAVINPGKQFFNNINLHIFFGNRKG